MFCKYCGKQISDNAKFCSKCGKQLSAITTENINSVSSDAASKISEEKKEIGQTIIEIKKKECTESEKTEVEKEAPIETLNKPDECNISFCKHCGNEVLEAARFCPKCGKEISKDKPIEEKNCVAETSIETNNLNEKLDTAEPILSDITTQSDEVLQKSAQPKERKFCKFCGKEIALAAMFCPKCGKKIAEPAKQPDSKQNPKANEKPTPISSSGSNHKNGKKFTVKNLFVQVFKKHSAEERDKILKAGFLDEIPNNPKITSESLQPWFYSRVFFILFAVFIVFEICLLSFENSNIMPGVMLIGSLMMPFAILTMYFELNIYKDISFYKVISIFLLGGAVSLLFTLFLYTVIPVTGEYNFFGASLISITEEIGKAVIVIVLLKRRKNFTVLQGLLIGGAIGCGFAVFESAGYAFNVFLDAHDYNTRVDIVNNYLPRYYQYGYANSINEMNFNIFLRSILSFGGHTAWAAIEGAAFAKTNKVNFDFIKAFGFCFLLHALWDTETPAAYLKLALLCIVAWMIIIKQISAFVSCNAFRTKEKEDVAIKEIETTTKDFMSEIPQTPFAVQNKKFCKYCGNELVSNAQFCSKCGKSLI